MGPAYNRREFKRGDVMHDTDFLVRMAMSVWRGVDERGDSAILDDPWPRASALVLSSLL